jgi:hypothetical protein
LGRTRHGPQKGSALSLSQGERGHNLTGFAFCRQYVIIGRTFTLRALPKPL